MCIIIIIYYHILVATMYLMTDCVRPKMPSLMISARSTASCSTVSMFMVVMMKREDNKEPILE